MLNWREEVDTIFQDLDRLYLNEDEARQQLNEIQDHIPEEELEAVWDAFELLAGEVEERLWCEQLDRSYDAYDGDDKQALN